MKWKICFNRGTLDWSKAWVVEAYREDGELSGVQYVVSEMKLDGAHAETVTAPDGCPQGYLVVTGRLILTDADTVAHFVE